MVGFLVLGLILMVLLAAGGWSVLASVRHPAPAGPTKRRHREEARQWQSRLHAEPDYTANFHHPTQNELLETLQALDHLTPGWDQDNDAFLAGECFKNELAESFPGLRRTPCVYPRPVDSELASRFHEGKLSPAVLEEKLRVDREERARRRAEFHAVRARTNARHQMADGSPTEPLTVVPGSLPFRVAGENRRRPVWALRFAVLALVIAAAGGVVYFYAEARPVFSGRRLASEDVSAPKDPGGVPTVNPVPTPSSVPSTTLEPPVEAVAGVGDTPPPEATTVPAVPESDAATVASPTIPEAPAATPVMPPLPTPDPRVVLAGRIAESKSRAVTKHPDLAVADSEINLRFVFRYKKMLADHSPRLQQPDWPETLADECALAAAAGSSVKPGKLAQRTPKPG